MHSSPYKILLLFGCMLASALHSKPRQIPNSIDDDGNLKFGLTVVHDAGIGVEFESPGFLLRNDKCSDKDTWPARKQIIGERTGKNWKLTADTLEAGGKLQAEYILDGLAIKVGSGELEKAGTSLVEDLTKWIPWKRETKPPPFNTVDVANSPCNPWQIVSPDYKKTVDGVSWSPQVTSAMPLEALYELMKEQHLNKPPSILNGYSAFPEGLTVVTKDFFQDHPNKIDGSALSDDVLAFCSLVLSYAKLATTGKDLRPGQSPKLFTTFMPRTEFNTMFNLVKSKLPGDLFETFNSLACYKNKKEALDKVDLDSVFCTGGGTPPKSNSVFGGAYYKNGDIAKMNVKEWIDGLNAGSPTPDLLTKFDATNDASIGGLGTTVEKLYKSERIAPLFEFRGLKDQKTSDIPAWLKEVDEAVVHFHTKYAVAPKHQQPAPALIVQGDDL